MAAAVPELIVISVWSSKGNRRRVAMARFATWISWLWLPSLGIVAALGWLDLIDGGDNRLFVVLVVTITLGLGILATLAEAVAGMSAEAKQRRRLSGLLYRDSEAWGVLHPRAFTNPFQPRELLRYLDTTSYPNGLRIQAAEFLGQAVRQGHGTDVYRGLLTMLKRGDDLARVQAAKTLTAYARFDRSKYRAIRSRLVRCARRDPRIRHVVDGL